MMRYEVVFVIECCISKEIVLKGIRKEGKIFDTYLILLKWSHVDVHGL